jgi:hypothetical protein
MIPTQTLAALLDPAVEVWVMVLLAWVITLLLLVVVCLVQTLQLGTPACPMAQVEQLEAVV